MSSRCLYYLAGDIGGTNCRFTLMRSPLTEDGVPDDLKEALVLEHVFATTQFNHLNSAVERFLALPEVGGIRPHVCVFAVAGPVSSNRCNMTSLNWFLDGNHMAEVLKVSKVILLNDFVALGYGLLALGPGEKKQLNRVDVVKDAPIACLGAGTGLGQTFLTWNGSQYVCWPSEGGHAAFAPRNELEMRLMLYVKKSERWQKRLSSVSVERLVAGPAIPRIYNFFCDDNPRLANPKITKEIFGKGDPSAAISKHALEATDALCMETMDLFVKMYGSEAGNLALKTLPFGGLYVAGGIAAKILPLLEEQDKFLENMYQKGRLRPELEKVPVFVVLHPQVGLLGAKVVSRRCLRELGHITSKL